MSDNPVEPTKTTTASAPATEAPAQVETGPQEVKREQDNAQAAAPPPPEPGAAPVPTATTATGTTVAATASPTEAPATTTAPPPATTVPTATTAPTQPTTVAEPTSSTSKPAEANAATVTEKEKEKEMTELKKEEPKKEEPKKEEAKKEAEPVEPQNPLTERFTQAEWAALKEFRTQLPDIFAKAYRDSEKPDAKTKPITMWGVTIDPKNPLNAKTSVVLMKFLRARNLNPTAAHEMLVATLRWRDEFNVEAACKEEFPKDIFGQLGHIYGKDKEGRPVVYNVYGGGQDIKAIFGDVDRFLRWRVAFMEKGLELLDFETVDQQIQVHDYEGVSMTSRDANSKNAASQASSIFGSHYPELLYKKFFINVPSYLSWIFWLFKPILPAATLAKMSVVGSGSYSIGKALLPFVSAEELPKKYGGKAQGF
ncbi:Non-classical phosphatidylinositol transfer protein (PITP) [Marasmius tenuissimus]|uniref:Non-classical phosphatidylinositol transfer protein (PITP) n=1 Tax=Marasmius tenuissimus TaxID=585030 RepID=A0ABR2ZEJ3_9AGAR